MGVSGSGKSLIGAGLARALDVEFVEGDRHHSAENIERMSRGIPLTDGDRAQWLQSLAARIEEARLAGVGLVMSCSALKRSYRDILRADAPNVRFVFLKGPQELIAQRISTRKNHYMPPSLLESQFNLLEEPSSDEDAWVCDINGSPQDLVDALVSRVSV